MKQVNRDGDVIVLRLPENDIQATVRFIAHSIEKNPDMVLDLSQQIVRGDLTQQDDFVEQLSAVLDIVDWSIVLTGPEALKLCDELAEAIYDEPAEQFGPVMKEKKNHLRLVTICVDCHKGYVKGDFHDCEAK